MWWRSLMVVLAAVLLTSLLLLTREERQYRAMPAVSALRNTAVTMTDLYAGGRPPDKPPDSEPAFSAFDVSEGKRLFHWFNCHGCHANGGGDVGPPLMDEQWLYGAEPSHIFATIVEGRPNGMPSFRGKIPDAQVWQIVGYIRSMSGHVPIYAKPGRNDDIQAKPPETMAPIVEPAASGTTLRPDAGR